MQRNMTGGPTSEMADLIGEPVVTTGPHPPDGVYTTGWHADVFLEEGDVLIVPGLETIDKRLTLTASGMTSKDRDVLLPVTEKPEGLREGCAIIPSSRIRQRLAGKRERPVLKRRGTAPARVNGDRETASYYATRTKR